MPHAVQQLATGGFSKGLLRLVEPYAVNQSLLPVGACCVSSLWASDAVEGLGTKGLLLDWDVLVRMGGAIYVENIVRFQFQSGQRIRVGIEL